MDLYALARQFVCMVIAATLSLTVSVVEKMLPQRPEWLEKVTLLEAQFRSLAGGGRTPETGPESAAETGTETATAAGAEAPPPSGRADEVQFDLQGLIDGYGKLLEFTQQMKLRGLNLDPEFCERVEREWSVKTLLSYMVSTDRSLKEQASEAHDAAAQFLSGRGSGNPAS